MSVKPLYDEKELLLQVAEGDEQAFNILFARYRNQLYSYLLRITKSPEVAEDIVVDIFMKLWVGKDLLHNIRELQPFLHKVAYNKAMDFFKVTARRARLQNIYIKRAGQQPEKMADEILIDAESRRILREAINRLSPKRKIIYDMSREQGLTYDQIADALNLSRNTVKATIQAATHSISQYLRKNYKGKGNFTLLFFLS